ncbi:MAG: hypothetical protein C0508_30865 [Cyanobacteria bacterium PR.023]|nr:hypothetical protein [Cyanobacteria bacterium PR.023]
MQIFRKATDYLGGGDPVLLSHFTTDMAIIQMNQRDFAPAAANFLESARFSEIRGDCIWRAEDYRQAAYCLNSTGDFAKGQAAATKALEMCKRIGPRANRELAYCQYHLGEAESHLGLQQSGIKHLSDSLAELKKYYPGEACYTYALWYLANCYRDIGDYPQAKKLYNECIEETRATGSGPDVAAVRKDLEKSK